jgi:hypothetical protein
MCPRTSIRRRPVIKTDLEMAARSASVCKPGQAELFSSHSGRAIDSDKAVVFLGPSNQRFVGAFTHISDDAKTALVLRLAVQLVLRPGRRCRGYKGSG